MAAPQGKLGAVVSGQPRCPLAHLESFSSTTINPWWAQELFLFPLMVAGGGMGGGAAAAACRGWGGGSGRPCTGDTELHRVPQGPYEGLDHEAKLSQPKVDLAPRD